MIVETLSTTKVTDATSPYDPADVSINVSWHVEVDDMLNIWNVQTSGSDGFGNPERTHYML